jgi:heavy metal sensor kinase
VSLRARLAWTYGAAVFVVVILLAIVALTAIDRSLRSSLDARLDTTTAAATAVVDVHDGRLRLDAEDRQQLAGALGGVMEIAVFQPGGDVYFTSAPAVPEDIIRLARRGREGLYSVGTGDRVLRVSLTAVARNVTSYGTIAIWQGSNFIDDFDKLSIVAIALAALGVGGVVVVLSSTLAQRALAPLERFTELATEIEAHDLSRRVASQGNDELGRLGSAFDRMLDRLESAFMRQRRFTADASHELRAPLAVIRAEADVALAKDRTTREYREALKTIVEEVDRIDALVDALLVAARADAANLHVEAIDLGEIASLAVARFQPAAQARGLTLEMHAQSAPVSGDAQALERAIAALLHNALDHAHNRIDVRVACAGGGVELTVEDDGPGFSAEGLAHATERFWRGDPARRRGGTGLGLSIADAIMQAHHGSVTLENAKPRGARVVVKMPFIAPSSASGTMGE